MAENLDRSSRNTIWPRPWPRPPRRRRNSRCVGWQRGGAHEAEIRLPGAGAGQSGPAGHRKVLRHRQGRRERLQQPADPALVRRHAEEGRRPERFKLVQTGTRAPGRRRPSTTARTRGVSTMSRTLAEAIVEGAALWIRPIAMTVAVILGGPLPIMWGSGAGSEVMRPIAVPMVGGTITCRCS